MKKIKSTGIAFSVENSITNKTKNTTQAPSKQRLSLASYIISSVSVILVYIGAAQLGGFAASAPIMAAILAISLMNYAACRGKYAAGILTVTVASICVAIVLINWTEAAETAKVFLNAIYEASESRQSYIYRKLATNEDFNAAANASMLFLPICLAVIQLICLGLRYGRKIGLILLMILCIVAEIYYGISPSVLINLIMFLILLVCILAEFRTARTDVHAWILMLICGLIICIAVNGVYPAKYHQRNDKIYAVNETVRDYFDVGEQRISSVIRPNFVPEEVAIEYDKAKVSQGERASKEKGDNNGLGGSKKHAANAKTVSVNIVTVIALVLFFAVVLLWGCAFMIARYRRIKAANSSDVGKSITYCVNSSLRLLNNYGLALSESAVPMDYCKRIEELTSEQYVKKYKDIIRIRQDLLYGNKDISLERRNQVIDFYMTTRRKVIKKSSFINKFKILLIRFL